MNQFVGHKRIFRFGATQRGVCVGKLKFVAWKEFRNKGKLTNACGYGFTNLFFMAYLTKLMEFLASSFFIIFFRCVSTVLALINN